MQYVLSVQQVQFDDLNPMAQLPVFMYGAPDGFRPWLHVQIQSLSKHPAFVALHDFTVRINPIQLCVDVVFFNDLLNSMAELRRRERNKVPAPAKKRERRGTRTGVLSARHILFDPVIVNISVRKSTTRVAEYPVMFPYLQYIPNVTDGRLEMPRLEFQDCIMTKGFVETEIMRPFRAALFRQAMKLCLSLDFLFNPSAFTTNISRQLDKLSKGRLASLAAIGASPLLQFGCHVMASCSRILHLISSDPDGPMGLVGLNQTAKEMVLDGIESASQKATEGADSVMSKAVEQAKSEGLIGVLSGFGEGFVDFVTKPLAGFVDAGIGFICGAKKAIEGDEAVFHRIRVGRVFPLKIIRTVDPFCGKIQYEICLTLRKFKERGEIVFQDVPSKRWVWMSQNFVVVVDEQPKIVQMWDLKTMVKGTNEGKKLELVFEKKGAGIGKCSCVVGDEEIATRAAKYAVYRANCLLVGGE
jgi:hypothetical protein